MLPRGRCYLRGKVVNQPIGRLASVREPVPLALILFAQDIQQLTGRVDMARETRAMYQAAQIIGEPAPHRTIEPRLYTGGVVNLQPSALGRLQYFLTSQSER